MIKILDCGRCPMYERNRVVVPGEGPDNAKVILIGESPGHEEVFQKRPFVGPAGQLLMCMVRKLGLEREDFYLTNVLKCQPIPDLPTGKKLNECIETCKLWLDEELLRLRVKKERKTIVLLGGVALRAFTGDSQISKYEGQEVESNIWAAYHPAFVMRNFDKSKEVSIYRVLYKACKQANLPVKREKWNGMFYHYGER